MKMRIRLLCACAGIFAVGIVVGWTVKSTPASVGVPQPSAGAAGMPLSLKGDGLRATLVVNSTEEKLAKIKKWNRSLHSLTGEQAVREMTAKGQALGFAQEGDAENPLLEPGYIVSVQITNGGALPALLLKGPAYLYDAGQNYSRLHRLFAKRDGLDYKIKKGGDGMIDRFRISYPTPAGQQVVSEPHDCTMLYPHMSVKDQFWLDDYDFELDPKLPATYRIIGKVTVCLLPSLEQVELTTDEIDIVVTPEHIREYEIKRQTRK